MNINKQQFMDIATEIVEMKRPKSLRNCEAAVWTDDKITISTLVYYDNKGKILIKQGVASKKKGDSHNGIVGELLSLMRAKTVK